MRREGFLGAVVLACFAPATVELGCGASDSSGTPSQANTGRALFTGGSTTTRGEGGTTGTGGALGSGGTSGMGGSVAAGGLSGTGGPGASGGGGASGYGGSSGSPTGGTTSRGGNSAGGGTGGSSTANGGAAGGGTASGGATESGGSNGTAGSKGNGGATASGGAVGTGGSNTIGTGPVTTGCPGAAPSGITPTWCSCGQWGQTTIGDATYYNDIWGSGAGPQCIWVAGNQWGVAANHPSGGGVKAYPNISYSPGKVISSLNTYTSSFQITVPSGNAGNWEVAYDYWVKNGATEIEIMLWVNYTQGKVFPAGSLGASNVTTGGSTWNVYYGAYGGHDVVSLLRTTNADSGTVDIMAITNWIITNKKSFDSSWTLDQVQFGPEIVSDGAVQSFVVNSFTVSSS